LRADPVTGELFCVACCCKVTNAAHLISQHMRTQKHRQKLINFNQRKKEERICPAYLAHIPGLCKICDPRRECARDVSRADRTEAAV